MKWPQLHSNHEQHFLNWKKHKIYLKKTLFCATALCITVISTENMVTGYLKLHISIQVKRPHYNHPAMFLDGGLGQQPLIVQTLFFKVVEKLPEGDWGVATVSCVLFNLWISVGLNWWRKEQAYKMGLTSASPHPSYVGKALLYTN